MSRVYLAGPSAELPRVREAAAVLVAAGHTITEPWWERIEADRAGRPTDHGVPVEALAASWQRNTDGICNADRVVALALSTGGLSQGTREEIAYAIGRRDASARWIGSPIIVGDPGASLAVTGCVVVETLAQALELLR